MAISLGTRNWGTAPVIPITFSYDYQRVGGTMQYRIYASYAATNGASHFGFPIYQSISLDGVAYSVGYTIKAQNPDRWYSALNFSSGWFSVNNKTSGSTALSIRVFSGSGSSRDTTYTFSLAVSPAGSSISIQPFALEDPFSVQLTKYSAAFVDNIALSINGATFKSVSGYASNDPIELTAEEILSAYKLIPSTATSATVTATVTTMSGSTIVGTSSAQALGTIAGTGRERVYGTWYRGVFWKNISGVWRRTVTYIHAQGQYRRGR